MLKQYKTEGKQKLIDFMSSHKDAHFTIDEICINLNGDTKCKSSIYRNLSFLCENEIVRKFRSEGQSSFVYQYIGERGECNNHFHLKCIRCDALVHLECHMGEEMKNHILSHHSFRVDCGRSILYGTCKECVG